MRLASVRWPSTLPSCRSGLRMHVEWSVHKYIGWVGRGTADLECQYVALSVSSPPSERKRFYEKAVVYEHHQQDCGE